MAMPVLKTLPCFRGMFFKLCKTKYAGTSICMRSYWRRSVFSELSSAMQAMENRMRDMDKEMSRVFGEFNRASPVKLPSIFSAFDSNRVREIPVVSTNGDGRTYRLELDVEGMQPENINITLKDHELSIAARIEETKSDGSRFVSEKKYHYTLPEGVNPDTIRSSLSNGVLTIEASLPALESKEIPVKIETSESDAKKQ